MLSPQKRRDANFVFSQLEEWVEKAWVKTPWMDPKWMSEQHFETTDQQLLLALCDVLTPTGGVIDEVSSLTLKRIEQFLTELHPEAVGYYRLALRTLNHWCWMTHGQDFCELSQVKRMRWVLQLQEQSSGYALIKALGTPIKFGRIDASKVYASVKSCAQEMEVTKAALPKAPESPRWLERCTRAADWVGQSGSEPIEVDAVIVGTGAGAGPIAKRLSAQGHAVLMLEEGRYHPRTEFDGDYLHSYKALYRHDGSNMVWGNGLFVLPTGIGVGGTTTINMGTCFRTPEPILQRWQRDFASQDFSPKEMSPYFEQVESMLGVQEVPESLLGGSASMIRKGCEKLGLSHGPLSRNAPGCDGQGVCCLGCPTDAKRSSQVSYVPSALESGAMLMTEAKVTEVLVRNGQAYGVKVRIAQDGPQELGSQKHREFQVHAKVVVLACGAIHTPALLLGHRDLSGGKRFTHGLANRSRQVGKNLTVHPASYCWALFDEKLDSHLAVPQSYMIDAFADRGIHFEGIFLPPDMLSASLNPIGQRWNELMNQYDHLAGFAFMLSDTSRGSVYLNAKGQPRVRYWMNNEDRLRFIEAQTILAQVYRAAGALSVFPGVHVFDELRSREDLERFIREAPEKLSVGQLDLSAHHPLGSCKMGTNPDTSVVGLTHETHDVAGLFICDGSTVSGPLGVNPQVTIMAMSERASQFIHARIESKERKSA